MDSDRWQALRKARIGRTTRATLLIYVVCGALHDLIVLHIVRHPYSALTAAFFSCELLPLTNRLPEPILNQDRWLSPLSALRNPALLGGSSQVAIQLEMAVYPGLAT
jgi:hypothetical protein